MKKKYSHFFTIAFFLTFCKKKKTYLPVLILLCWCCRDKEIVYKAPDFEKRHHAEAQILNDTVMFNHAEQLYIIDSLLIMADFRFDKYIFIFNKNTGKLLCTSGKKGKGPGELITPVQLSVNRQTKDLYIHDYDKHKLFRFSIPEILAGSDIPQEEISLNQILAIQNHISYFKDSLFISSGHKNRLLIASLRDYKIEENERFPEIVPTAKEWNSFLQNWSCNALSPDNKKYVRATLLGGIMEIFTISNEKIELEQQHFFYKPAFEKKGSQYLPIAETVYGLRHLAATDRYIYASLIGQANPQNLPKTIHRFDWKGNPVDYFETPYEIENFTVSEDDSNIYATVYVNQEQFPAVIHLKDTEI